MARSQARVGPLSDFTLAFILIATPVTGALGPYLAPASIGVQLYAFRVLILVAAPLLLSMTALRPPLVQPARAFALILYIWIAWGAASIAWTPDPATGATEVVAIAFGAVAAIVIVTSCSMQRSGSNILRMGWVLAYVATALVALWELQTHQHLESAYASLAEDTSSGIVVSTFGNPNNYAAFIVLAFPYLLWSLGRSRLRSGWIHVALCISAPVLLVLTEGRLSLAALVAELLVFALLQRGRGMATLWFVPLALGIGGVLYFVVQLDPNTLDKITRASGEFSTGGSSSIRLNLILNALQFTADSYGLGMGAGSFSELMRAGKGDLPTRYIVNPHNFWMEVLSQYGVVIFTLLVGYLLYLTRMTVTLLRSRQTQDNERYWALVTLALSLTGYWFAASENSSFIPQPVNWVFLGSVTALAARARSGRSYRDEPRQGDSHSTKVALQHLDSSPTMTSRISAENLPA